MFEIGEEQVTPVIRKITRRVFTLNVVVSSIVLSLFGMLLLHSFPLQLPFFMDIPDLSVSVILAVMFLLSLTGLYLSMKLSREAVRIIRYYSNRLERMLNITKDLRDEVYGDILLEKIMDYALDITQSEAGSLLLFDDKKNLVFRIVRGKKASQLIGKVIEPGKGIIGWVALECKPLHVENTKTSERFNPEFDALTGYETKSILCVPLTATSGVLGVIALLNKQGGYAYRQRDQEIISYLAEQAAISILKTQFLEDQKNYEIHLTDILLETIDFQQPEKRGHARRVARYGNVIAKAIGMPEDKKKRLYLAGLLHDVGFLRINLDEAYKKEVHMQHAGVGYEMIKPITFYADIAPFILHHHQRFDGYGYPPANLKGEEIPLEARIIAIAEAFDVMISPQSYKVPRSFEDALHELRQKAGSQFDPHLVEAFVGNITLGHTK